MDCNFYFGNFSGVENKVSFQNNVRYSEVVAKRDSDGLAVPKIHTKSGAARADPAPIIAGAPSVHKNMTLS